MTQLAPASEPARPAANPPSPLGRRCPSIDALTLYRVAIGELSLRIPIVPIVVSEEEAKRGAGETLPLASRPEGYNNLRQPRQNEFDAWAIYEISGHAHPWLAPAVSPLPLEHEDGAASMAG